MVISRKMHFFRIVQKLRLYRHIDFFSVYQSGLPFAKQSGRKLLLKIFKKKKKKKKKDLFNFFSPKLCNTTKVFQNTANLKSMSMQMISDKMHFDAVALRPKNAI